MTIAVRRQAECCKVRLGNPAPPHHLLRALQHCRLAQTQLNEQSPNWIEMDIMVARYGFPDIPNERWECHWQPGKRLDCRPALGWQRPGR
jgi:hypothetical protein